MLRCPTCHDDLRNDHARLRCTHCETQVHAGCRSLSRGRCPTLGCKGTLPGGSRRKRFSPRFQPPLRSLTLGRLAATSGGVALGTCLLLAATVFSLFMADYHGPLWGLLAVGCVAGYLVGLPAFALRGALNQRGNPLRGSLMGYALISLIPGHVLGVLACLALCVVGREGGVIASIVLEPALVTLFGGLFLGRLVQRDALQPQPSRERCLAPAPPLPSARRQIKIHLAPRAAAA